MRVMPSNDTLPVMADLLMTSPQVAYHLGKSLRTIHRMVANGDLTPVQKLPGPNGAFLFLRADVERLAKKAA